MALLLAPNGLMVYVCDSVDGLIVFVYVCVCGSFMVFFFFFNMVFLLV